MSIQNSDFINALFRQPVKRTPIWLMRQAGRYLPEYRALREKTPNFLDFCSNPELCAQATLQPLQRFDLDAAIIFSDILVVPAAMGMQVEFIKGDGPHFPQPLRHANEIDQLNSEDVPERLSFVMEAIRLTQKNMPRPIPLIGFAGSPWTCATYMVEGGASKNFSIIKTLLFRRPDLLHDLLQRITTATVDYLNAQIKAGVQAIMVFDTWGGVLSHADYPLFSLNYLRQISQGLQRQQPNGAIPLIFFTKGGGQWLKPMAESGCDALGLDWMTDIKAARAQVGGKVALQGNLDPCCLFAEPEQIQRAARKICFDYGVGSGHIFNLGHGVLPSTPTENVQILVETVHQFSHGGGE